MRERMDIQQSFQLNHSCGTLYLVGTPIGNLEDITFRAIRMLRESAWIAAEDTRHTRKLLAHYEISNRMISYHEHNKEKVGPQLIEKLLSGESVALVSDAGLPAISDPGSDLVKSAIVAGIPVVPIPGANAALAALIASGLSSELFTFLGFLPRDKKKASALLRAWEHSASTVMFYEAPHRLTSTLRLLHELWGLRRAVVARELTKRYEEFVRGSLQTCLLHSETHQPLGEYCILVEGNQGQEQPGHMQMWWTALSLVDHVATYEQQHGYSHKEALKQVAVDRNLSRRDVYNELHQQREVD